MGFFPCVNGFYEAKEGGDAKKDDEVTGYVLSDEAKARADQECILDGLLVNDGGFEHAMNTLHAEARDGEFKVDLENLAANSHGSLEDNVADLTEGFLYHGSCLRTVEFVFDNDAREGFSVAGPDHQQSVTFQRARKDLMDAPDLVFKNPGQGRGEILKENDFHMRNIQGDAFAGEIAEGTGSAAISDVDQFLEHLDLRKERPHRCGTSETR